MPEIDLHSRAFDDGTKTKLDIFGQYLEEWLPVFIYNPLCSHITICDFFAGSGTDAGGNPGSPLIILEVIKKFHDQIVQKKKNIKIILNDDNKKKIIKLKPIVETEEKELGSLNDFISIEIYNKDFKDLFLEKKKDLQGSANLLFLDQNGVKHITRDLLREINMFSETDFMFFISSSYFKRFSFEEYFPNIDFSKVKIYNIHRELLNHYKNWLPPGSTIKLYPFSIKKKGKVYGLIFGSKHPLGIEKFLKIVWRKNSINGEANFDIDQDRGKGQRLLWGNQKMTKIDAFKDDLQSLIIDKRIITNKEILEFSLENGFDPKIASDHLRDLKKHGVIEPFVYPKIGCRQIFSNNEVVTFRACDHEKN